MTNAPHLPLQRRLLPWAGLLLGILATLTYWRDLHEAEGARLAEFQRAQADTTAERIERRMLALKQILKGTSLFLSRGDLPTRTEWKTYNSSLELPKSYPGIQGLGFVLWIPAAMKAAHEQKMRAAGFPGYRVEAGGPLPADPDGCSSVIYLEPMDERNQRAFGRDMWAEVRRREAMAKARDSGLPALTAPITLYQESTAGIQAGTDLYAPVYRNGQPVDTIAQRRQAFIGWAYYPFRMDDLMRATLEEKTQHGHIVLRDQAVRPGSPPVFDSNPECSHVHAENHLDRQVEVAGRTWTVRTWFGPDFMVAAGLRGNWGILAIGGLGSALLFALLRSVIRAEARAEAVAAKREQELLASEAQFRALFDLAPDAVSLTRLSDGFLVEVNLAWENLFGYSRDEALGRSMDDLGLYADPEERKRLFSILSVGGSMQVHELQLLRKDRSAFRAQLLGTVGKLGGEPSLLVVLRDVSATRAAQAQLERQQHRYSLLMSTSLDAIHVIDRAGRLREWNPAFLEHLGYTAEEAVNLKVSDWDRRWTEAELLEEIAALIRSPRRFQTVHRRKDGTLRTVEISGTGVVLDGEAFLYAAGRDITQALADQAVLAESEARLRTVLENAADGIYIHDSDGRFLLCNEAACLSTGYSREELLSRRVMDVAPDVPAEQLLQSWRNLAPGQQLLQEMPGCRKDGTRYPVEVHLTLLHEQEPRQFLAMVRDLGDRKRVEETELRAKKAESLVLMAGSIAHDFNNLFQALLSSLEMADVKSKDNPQATPPLRTGKDVLRRAVALSWKMLDFSGRAVTRPRPEDLAGLLAGWAAELGQKLSAGAKLELELGEVPKVSVDAEKLRMVLDALLDNAREAMVGSEQGRVRLKLFVDFGEDRPRPQSRGFWAADPPPGAATVCLEIADDGPGADPMVLNRMFDPFFTTKELGRGLGLPSALGLLQAHRAGVHVLPGENGGLVFRIHFPPAGP